MTWQTSWSNNNKHRVFLLYVKKNYGQPLMPKLFFPSQKKFWIYFFLRRAIGGLFFLGECLLKFLFSWRRASEIFFLGFLGNHPRSLMLAPLWFFTCCTKGYSSRVYTLLQKKRNFSGPIFPGDPGTLTLPPGHVHFVKWI